MLNGKFSDDSFLYRLLCYSNRVQASIQNWREMRYAISGCGAHSIPPQKTVYEKRIGPESPDAGFEVVATISFVSILFPLMLYSRLKAATEKDFDPMLV